MAAEVLGMLFQPGVNQQPIRVLNGAPNNFGNPIAVAPPDTNSDAISINSNAISGQGIRLGNEFFICVTPLSGGSALQRPTSIRVFDPTTNNWVTTGNAYNATATDRAITNMKVGLNGSGVARAFCIQGGNASANQGRVLFRDLGGAPGWTGGAFVNPNPGRNPFYTNNSTGILYRNQLHWGHGGTAYIADPISLGFTVQNLAASPSASFGKVIMGVAQGRLFAFAALDYNTGSTSVDSLFEFTGSWSEVINGFSPGIVNNVTNTLGPFFGGWSFTPTVADKTRRLNCRRAVLFEDPATRNLILILYEDFNGAQRGLRVFSIDLNTLTPTEYTIGFGGGPAIAPPSIAWDVGPDITVGNQTSIDMVLNVDTVVNPSNPTITIGILFNNGNYTWYQWNGLNATMTNVGSGQSILSNITHVDNNGGGENIYEGSSTLVPALYVHEVGRIELEGKSQILLQGFAFDETGGSPATPNRDVELLYSRTFGGTPTSAPSQKATLSAVAKDSGPGATPTLSGGNITGMDFDNGATTVSADWDAIDDGLFKGEQHNLMPRVRP